MQLTKHTHSCVRLEDGDRALVLDPGSFASPEELDAVLDGAGAVLITHEHVDHVEPEALRRAKQANPGLAIYATPGVAQQIADLQPTAVDAGQEFEAAGFAVRTFGGRHAVIHPSIAMGFIANVGYLIDGSVYHPGDSLVVPDAPVETLLLPAHAPWSKTGELIDFTIAVRPERAHPVHDGLLNDRGVALVDRLLTQTTSDYGVGYQRLGVGESA